MISSARAVLDACILVPACLRDTLLRLFEADMYQARWSRGIIEELRRTLEIKLRLPRVQVNRLVNQLRESFPQAWIANYEHLIPSLTNNPKDRHVLAAAIHGKCEIIVTSNTRDFPASATAAHGVEVWHPDEFLIELYRTKPNVVLNVLQQQGSELNPPQSAADILQTLGQTCPKFAGVAAKSFA